MRFVLYAMQSGHKRSKTHGKPPKDKASQRNTYTNPVITSPYSRCSLISTFGRTSARFTKTRRYKGGANRRKPTTKNTLPTLT